MIRVADARFLVSASNLSQCPKAPLTEVAFAGRSNVGKSSMINALCGRRGLVRVSNTPGRTRLMNFFDVDLKVDGAKRTLRLCDLPGYGYAKASKSDRAQWATMIDEYLAKRNLLKACVAIVDGEIGALANDLEMIDYLQRSDAKILVAATKIDRVPKSQWLGRRQKIAKQLSVPLEAVVGFSATKKLGVDEVWDRLVGATL
jgi:GTP-binding protein